MARDWHEAQFLQDIAATEDFGDLAGKVLIS